MTTDSERIRKLEVAVERLCDFVERLNLGGFNRHIVKNTEIELIKQYVRGDLDGNK